MHINTTQKKGRQKKLAAYAAMDLAIIFYESPYRIVKLLQEINDVFGSERMISVSREISKIHEETLRGTAKELIEIFKQKPPKGEFVVITDKPSGQKNNEDED